MCEYLWDTMENMNMAPLWDMTCHWKEWEKTPNHFDCRQGRTVQTNTAKKQVDHTMFGFQVPGGVR